MSGDFRHDFDLPRIYLPRNRTLCNENDPIEMKVGFKGFFRCVLRKGDHVLQDTGWFPNVITNNGMVQIRDNTSWIAWCQLGSNNTAPAVTDTNCLTPVGSRKSGNLVVQAWASANAYLYHQYKYTFSEGESTGSLRELALFQNSSGGNCFNRVLIVDGAGTPTTIVKGADNILDVYYELRDYPIGSDATGTIDISGTNYDYIARNSRVGELSVGVPVWGLVTREIISSSTTLTVGYNNVIGAATGSPSGSSSSLSGVSGSSITVTGTGAYYNDMQIQCGLDGWNFVSPGLRSVRFPTGNAYWQVQYTKSGDTIGILKTDEQRLRLNFRLSWTRL